MTRSRPHFAAAALLCAPVSALAVEEVPSALRFFNNALFLVVLVVKMQGVVFISIQNMELWSFQMHIVKRNLVQFIPLFPPQMYKVVSLV